MRSAAVVRRRAAGSRQPGRPGAKCTEVRCFHGADKQVRLWVTLLWKHCSGSTCESAVVVVSADYATGDWTRLERRTDVPSRISN